MPTGILSKAIFSLDYTFDVAKLTIVATTTKYL
jgi:hypothetical protein